MRLKKGIKTNYKFDINNEFLEKWLKRLWFLSNRQETSIISKVRLFSVIIVILRPKREPDTIKIER